MKCDYCKKEADKVYLPPLPMFDTKTGERVEQVMCKECLEYTVEEVL